MKRPVLCQKRRSVEGITFMPFAEELCKTFALVVNMLAFKGLPGGSLGKVLPLPNNPLVTLDSRQAHAKSETTHFRMVCDPPPIPLAEEDVLWRNVCVTLHC